MYLRNLYQQGSCLACLVVVFIAPLRVHAVGSPLNNIDIVEPIVRTSPAIREPDNDLFGWAAVLHQIVAPANGDSHLEAAEKTRLVSSYVYTLTCVC